MASWARQRQQITEAADGGARARTTADGSIVLSLRRGPGAYALLSRANGQLTRAGQHYYAHLGLRPPSRDFDFNQPLIREGPNDYILLRNGQKKLVRSLEDGEHRLTRLGRAFFRDKYYEYLVHVPVIIRGTRRSGRNAGAVYERRDWLPINELGGAMTRHPAGLTEEQVAQRVRRQVEASLGDPRAPILQLSDEVYFLDPDGQWVVSTQSTQYRNSRTEVETLLRQRMRGLRSVCFQLPCEEDVLPGAFEDGPLCVPRQLAELLQLSLEEVCADFDAMLEHDWRSWGISAEEIREFCVWRNAPMRFLSSQGDLVDSYDPALKERRTVCFLCFDGHCFMYKSVKKVLERQAWRTLYRGDARLELPPVAEWKPFDPEAAPQPGLFWCEDLREARRRLMAAGHSPKVALSSPAQYCGLKLRCGMRVRELPEEHELLRRWCEALGLQYRGQRLAGLAQEVFLRLLKAKREVPTAAERQRILAGQGGRCALCGRGVTAGTCELDHVVPVRQLFADSEQRLQALCEDCHGEKTLRESAQPTSLESRVAPGVLAEYVRSPKLPPLVFEAQASDRGRPYVGVDVVRCRRNGLANAPFALPILCPADGIEPVEPGRLPDLGFVEGCCDSRQATLQLLPYVGPGWYPKVSLAAMLDAGACRWDHIPLGIYARGHVAAATLRRALERMDAAWPEGEEHMAKLSVNAMIGLWARSTDVVYSVRSSSSELDGPGADFRQSFAYEGGAMWDFVYARRLLSNGTYRPLHDAVLGFEHCMVAKARRLLEAPPRHLKQVKTDCLLTQGLPRRCAARLDAVRSMRHEDGTPMYRVEAAKPLLGRSEPPRMAAARPEPRGWHEVHDPVEHCLAGNSLLLTGLPGTGKTHLARTIVARLREQGEAVHLVSKTHCSAQNLGLGAQTADHWVRRYVRGGSVQKLDWLVAEEITQLDMALWADLACVGLNEDVKFLLLGDFRQLPAVLDSWAGRPISAPLEHSQLVLDLAGGHRHELTGNMRSDPGIFEFVKWLRVGEPDAPGLGLAKARARELFPAKPGWPDTTLVISHARRVAVNAAANRALAPEGAKLLELETNVVEIDLGGVECATPPKQPESPQNRPQSMRVWPGLRLIGAGGRIPKGVFVAVAEVEPEHVRLDNGLRLKHQDLLRATRLSHAVTYASCQGLTLRGRVRLDLGSGHVTERHLYVGASRATSSALLEAA